MAQGMLHCAAAWCSDNAVLTVIHSWGERHGKVLQRATVLCWCIPQAAERPIPPQLFGIGEVATPELQVCMKQPSGMLL